MADEIWLIRHAETEWSKAKKHTGRTDVPLTDEGREHARALRGKLAGVTFSTVLVSPLSRARETAELADLGDRMQLRDDLMEWDYGAYEGITTEAIRADRPGWFLWRDGVPEGEAADDVGARADRVIAEAVAEPGAVALVAHGHVLRVLAARWIDLAPSGGALLALATATVSVLGWERDVAVIRRWNMPPGTPTA
jgi:broad specificity phosphatase PhoE